MKMPTTMTDSRTKWVSGLVLCCALGVPALAWQGERTAIVKRLYVEPFTSKAGSEKIREDLIGELRKQSSISLVSSESTADAILGGGGEIWIKGYRSLNPRSGRLPSDGTPVYAGYLSVELRNPRGETLWSYLATPGTAPSEDVSRDLAKKIANHLVEALRQGEAPLPTVYPAQPSTILKGAGATFPYPVYAKWFTNYRRENPNVEISYDPIGSEAGVRTLLSGSVDFGASDSPEVIRQFVRDEEAGYLLFPSVVGAVVPIVNLPGFSGNIAFTPEALAGIYLGKIKKWNDPVLRQANRGLQLPDLDIVVVHRADGSGTSYAWTDFLSKTVPEWKTQVGSGLAPNWPVGRAAAGNEGVARLVKEIGGSIGYVEFIYALQNHLSFGKVRNRRGEFVEASLESIAAAADQAEEIHDDFKVSIVNAPGEGAYPIASFTWLVVPAHIADDGRRNAIEAFLKWMLGPGQTQAAALGYAALPKDLVTREEAAIGKIR
jgi:phosphate ABC transporter phosphate-binding protein